MGIECTILRHNRVVTTDVSNSCKYELLPKVGIKTITLLGARKTMNRT